MVGRSREVRGGKEGGEKMGEGEERSDVQRGFGGGDKQMGGVE